MPTEKMQCYIKSVKKDTDSILMELMKLKPAIIEFLIKLILGLGMVLICIIIIAFVTYSAPYIATVVAEVANIFEMITSQQLITQYNIYLAVVIITDFCVFWCVRDVMMDTYGDPNDKLPFSQMGYSIIFLFILFVINAMFVILTWVSLTPERFAGWSFMVGETVINMIGVMVGILLIRAYLKCEGKIVSV